MHKLFTALILTFIASTLFNLKPSYSINFVNLFKIGNYPNINYSNEIYFKNAYKDYKHGNYKRAAGLFWLYTVKGRLLRGYALYYEGICLLKLKEYRKAKYVFSKLVGSDKEAFFHENAVFYLAISEGGSGHPYSEILNLKYVTRYSIKRGLRSRAMLKIYEVYRKLKEYARANTYLLKTYIDYPLFSKKHNIRFKTASLTEPQKIRRGINLYYGSYYSESLSVLRKTGGYGEDNGINRRVRFIILRDLAGTKSPLFLKGVKSCLNSDNDIACYQYYGVKRSELLNLEAYYYYRTLRNSQKALNIFNNTARKYGYLNKDAMNAYKTVVWSMVLNNLKNGRLVNAAKILKSFFIVDDAVNESTAKFLFWYGVILKKLGFAHEASFYFNIIKGSKLLRYSYYGVMSVVMIDGGRERMHYRAYGISDGGNKFADMAFKYMPALKIYLKKNQALNIKLKRLKAFLNLKLYHLANISTQGFIAELRKQRFRGVKGYPVYSAEKLSIPVVYMLYKTKNYEAAISLASNLIYDFRYRFLLLNKRFLTVLYPRPYYDYVHRYSVSYGVQANLIYAIMRQESLYDPTSYSSADAIGLMQIIPPTGYYIAKRIGRYDFNPAMLYKKNVNINFGSYYLKILLNRFHNRKYLAIASYNAGPLAVASWKNNLPKKYDPSLFIELIPVKQTRHYVKAVLANYYIYNLLYGHYKMMSNFRLNLKH